MKPFQVNCSDLIADFSMHEDQEVREVLTFLTSEYNVEIFFQTSLRMKEFFFNDNFTFNAEIDGIKFIVTVSTEKFTEHWTTKLLDEKDMKKLINGIEKFKVNKYGGESEFASNYFIRLLNNHIITLLPNYHTEIEKGLMNQINIHEIFDVDIKIGSGESATTLFYGNNCYDYSLGWYFECEHWEHSNYPFYEWAERNYDAKIKPLDGGSIYNYNEYLENPNRERLRKKP